MTALLLALATLALGSVIVLLWTPLGMTRDTACPLHGLLSDDRLVRTTDGRRHCSGCYADALRDAPPAR
jgi:hypothetical protein